MVKPVESLESLDQPVETLKISQEHPEIYAHPEVLRTVLLPLELWCLSTMIIMKKPLSSSDLLFAVLGHTYWKKPDYVVSFIEKILPKKMRVGNPAKYYLDTKHDFTWGIVEEWKSELRKEGWDVPNMRRINSAMQTLQSWGVVTQREYDISGVSRKSNARMVWVLMPSFTLKYGERLREYFSSVVVDPF